MGVGLSGADLEALDRLRELLDHRATGLSGIATTAGNDVAAIDRLWDGPDSAAFRQAWLTVHRPRLLQAVAGLRDAADTVARNRDQQERTSALDGAGSGLLGPALPLGAGPLLAGPLLAGGASRLVDEVGDFLFGDLVNFWNGGDDGFPLGQLIAALAKMPRIAGLVRPIFPTSRLGIALAEHLVGRAGLLRTGGLWLQSPGAATAFTRLGIAGGLVSTGLGVYDLAQQGNPIDAFQREGAGYVADVASTAFSASTTAFLVAPTPLTAGLAIGTGLVWAGAEVVEHWDDITAFAGDSWDAATGAVGDVWDAGTNMVDGAWDAGADLAGDAWDAGTGFLDDVGDGLGGLAGGAVSSIGGLFGG